MNVLKAMPFQVNNKIVEMVKADKELTLKLKDQLKAAHKALWDAVHEEYPELGVEAQYTLKCEYSEQGIVMLDTADNDPASKLMSALGRLVKDIN